MDLSTEGSTSIKSLFQGMMPAMDCVIQGTVTSVSPLTVQATNNEKLTISSTILICPKHLTDYTTTVSISIGSGSLSAQTNDDEEDKEGTHGHPSDEIGDEEGEHTHTLQSFTLKTGTMTVHNALKVGDVVHLLSFDSGKKYYILDRVV